MSPGEFSVYQFFPDGGYECVLSFVDGKAAVYKARDLTTRPAAQIGVIARVIITDGGDNTTFEWKFGEGVTYPPQFAGFVPRPEPLP